MVEEQDIREEYPEVPWNATPDQKLNWCMLSIAQVRRQLIRPNKPWYTSISIWFCILLVIIVLILVYVFILSEIGWGVILPEWMNR